MHEKSVLFILKRREDYSHNKHSSHPGLSTGLWNSANYVNVMLQELGIKSNLVVVTDNNDIDREVTKYKPTFCIIEALWVVPSKFTQLSKLHPDVTWIIRLHSELPFLANEGIAMDWIIDYARHPKVIVACNAPRMLNEVRFYIGNALSIESDFRLSEKVIYLPNFYKQEYQKKKFQLYNNVINIGCFGAVRPLKNHIEQAIAAVKFADYNGLYLNFHINGDRMEMKGEPVMHNLRGMFQHLQPRGHELICHTWTPREQFLELCASMDIGMQVSFSETFNIVGADLISQGVPLVASSEIPWADKLYCADPTDSDDICKILNRIYNWPGFNTWANKIGLKSYTNTTKKVWHKYFRK